MRMACIEEEGKSQETLSSRAFSVVSPCCFDRQTLEGLQADEAALRHPVSPIQAQPQRVLEADQESVVVFAM